MRHLPAAVAQFLAAERIAVVGVSRDSGSPANLIYRKLRANGHQVFAVNPRANQVEGDVCYPAVAAIPDGVEAAVVVTPPSAAAAVVDACAAAGVGQVWLHRSVGDGSFSPEAVERARVHGMKVIPGGCPMMYCSPVDPGHACMRAVMRLTGRLPGPTFRPAA
jgi:uncharacterized protein